MHAAYIAILLAVVFAPTGAHADDTALPAASNAPCAAAGRAAYAPWAFLGYDCAGDCAAHKAGFAEAERAGIADPAACSSQDPRRAEGCRAYAEGTVTPELAGFEWARENEIAQACACSGAGEAFEAGCRAYVEATGE